MLVFWLVSAVLFECLLILWTGIHVSLPIMTPPIPNTKHWFTLLQEILAGCYAFRYPGFSLGIVSIEIMQTYAWTLTKA